MFLDSPYNYLVDPGVREVMGINLKDAVVIFDEVSGTGSSLASLAALLNPGLRGLIDYLWSCGAIAITV